MFFLNEMPDLIQFRFVLNLLVFSARFTLGVVLHFYCACFCRCEFVYQWNVYEQRVLCALFLNGLSLCLSPFFTLHLTPTCSTHSPHLALLSFAIFSIPFSRSLYFLLPLGAHTITVYFCTLTLQAFHFYFLLHLVPLSRQSSTSSLTLMPTGPGGCDVYISSEQTRTHLLWTLLGTLHRLTWFSWRLTLTAACLGLILTQTLTTDPKISSFQVGDMISVKLVFSLQCVPGGNTHTHK